MSLRVTIYGEVKGWESWSLRETESEEGAKSYVVDPKPGDLVMGRLKLR